MGRAEGYGEFIYPNGDCYQGEWKKDKANGWGILIKTSDLNPSEVSLILKGEFMDNELNGFGTLEIKQDGSKYEGNFKNGIRDGWGVFQWLDGPRIEGFWKEGKIYNCVRKIKTKIYREFTYGLMEESTLVNGERMDFQE